MTIINLHRLTLPKKLHLLPTSALKHLKYYIKQFILTGFEIDDHPDVTEFLKSVDFVIDSASTLRQIIGNSKATALSTTDDDCNLITPCPCATGQFAAYTDVNIGHVLTTQMEILSDILPSIAHNHIGSNMSVMLPSDSITGSNILIDLYSQPLHLSKR